MTSMSIILFKDQQVLKNKIYEAWGEGHANVMAVSPTGSGKTVIFSDILREHSGAACAIAHRQELVSQISMALARDEVRHKIIGPDKIIKCITAEHHREFGKDYYDPNSPVGVAGVDTLIRRGDSEKHWLTQVTKWVMDEGHHVLKNNKWGKAIALMPNAIGLAVTASPCRADGKGLSRSTDGLMDHMVEGLTLRQLIDIGRLCDYRIFAPPSDLDLSNVNIAKDGDYSKPKLKVAVKKSHMVGDVVDHYKKITFNKLCIVFATDVDTATEIAANFNTNGIKSEVLSAKSSIAHRTEILKRFKNRDILVLVNVDLFGEGFDLPAIEVVSMARPTQSYGLYVQQFGRALRVMKGKSHAVIIDHAGNVMRHGLPDKARMWSMDAREKKPTAINPEDDIPLRYCVNCTQPYERFYKKCPYCGYCYVPDTRNAPEFVDGDLLELSPSTLAEMRGEVARIDAPAELTRDNLHKAGFPIAAQRGAMANHVKRQKMQTALRESISWWAAYEKSKGHDDHRVYRTFYHLFGVDIMSAQALGKREAINLAFKVNNHIGNYQL